MRVRVREYDKNSSYTICWNTMRVREYDKGEGIR